MLPDWLFDPNSPYFWVVVGVGVACGGLVFAAGRFLLNSLLRNARRRVYKPAEVPSSEPSIRWQTPLEDNDPFNQGNSPGRRDFLRREGNSVEVQITDLDMVGAIQKGWVVDRSLGGLCLYVLEPLKEGTVINIRPANTASITPWTQVEIRTCTQEEGQWKLGCQFVRTPPYSVLLMFG
jgi:hypothetical protein